MVIESLDFTIAFLLYREDFEKGKQAIQISLSWDQKNNDLHQQTRITLKKIEWRLQSFKRK